MSKSTYLPTYRPSTLSYTIHEDDPRSHAPRLRTLVALAIHHCPQEAVAGSHADVPDEGMVVYGLLAQVQRA